MIFKAFDSANYSNYDNRTAYRLPGDREAGSAIDFTRSNFEYSEFLQIDKESPGLDTMEKTEYRLNEKKKDSANQSQQNQ